MKGILRSSAMHTAAGGVLMGSWAWFANRGFDWPAPVLAALVQGAITASITYVMKRVIETVSARSGGIAQFILPPMAAAMVSASVLIGLHSLAGTPALWLTIAVPFSVATVYAVIYAATLARGSVE